MSDVAAVPNMHDDVRFRATEEARLMTEPGRKADIMSVYLCNTGRVMQALGTYRSTAILQ